MASTGEREQYSQLAEQKKASSSVHDVRDERPPFGSRYLTPQADVWSKNAWDHVPPPDDQDDRISSVLARQRAVPVREDDKLKYNEKPAKHWDKFYKMNAGNFFRDRKWLHTEFPELLDATRPDAGPLTVAELGCGAGNSVFPLLVSNRNPLLSLFAVDYSNHAVKLVQENELYALPPTGSIRASVWDLTTAEGLPEGIAPSSVDIVILVFVLSALHPDEWAKAISNVYKMLKPGGLVLIRDYGRYDLTQLRFKEERLLEDNFYMRGDKTRVYFFELDEVALLFTGSLARPCDKLPTAPDTACQGQDVPCVLSEEEYTTEGPFGGSLSALHTLDPSTPHSHSHSLPSVPQATQSSSIPLSGSVCTPEERDPEVNSELNSALSNIITSSSTLGPLDHIHPILRDTCRIRTSMVHPVFATEQLGVDRRLLVNRKRQLKMYRVWIQGKFRKSSPAP